MRLNCWLLSQSAFPDFEYLVAALSDGCEYSSQRLLCILIRTE